MPDIFNNHSQCEVKSILKLNRQGIFNTYLTDSIIIFLILEEKEKR